jgi:hypothetical protein
MGNESTCGIRDMAAVRNIKRVAEDLVGTKTIQ